ncbi:hypothetical protein JAAARDRAFT_31107 [Jaapia argillacea MUCL 33604]|uniref:Steroid 5-alpha reductase C-terminal domain-containing protein n=1 Tax=Jaapia argillacea MUCL 33604 TaxID=933084 RepID=A0A067Q3J4_9AGAM|nr:hypothetical protein JAAARDRAFT_31107 [Jaapia argillacea MUCL 33604]
MPIQVLDPFNLGLTILITVAYQLLGFLVAWTLQFDKITDFTGGSNFFILALVTLGLAQTSNARNVIVTVLTLVWASRLAGFLLYRVLKVGSDSRFDEIRSHFWQFFGFWMGQIIWVWTVSLPVTIVNSPAVLNSSENTSFGTAADGIGLTLWIIGWLTESIADLQKFRYKASRPPQNRPIQIGLWYYSRHPPYFGEILCWWGIWTLAFSATSGAGNPAKHALYGSVVSPLFTTFLLMFASGIPTAEKPQAKKFYLLTHGSNAKDENANAWANYQAYLESTSILFPVPPMVYRRLPPLLKRTLLLDFPMYQFDENIDGSKAVEEERSVA